MLYTFLIYSLLALFPYLDKEKHIAYEGAIVLENDMVITGTFYFEEKKELLYKRKEKGLEIFPIYKVKALYFYDASQNINRQFIKIASDNSLKRFSYQLYEVVLNGEVKVLRKRKLYDYPAKDASLDLSKVDQHAYNYHYFIHFNNRLIELRDFYKKVFPYMLNQYPKEISNLVEEFDWNIHKPSAAIQLIKKYNRLTNTEALSL